MMNLFGSTEDMKKKYIYFLCGLIVAGTKERKNKVQKGRLEWATAHIWC